MDGCDERDIRTLINVVQEQMARNEALTARVRAMLAEALEYLARQDAELMGNPDAVAGPSRTPEHGGAHEGTTDVGGTGAAPPALAEAPPAPARSAGSASPMERRVRATDPPHHRLASDPTRRRLTPREREVAQLVADGLKDTIIARRLGLGMSTVRSHILRIKGKLQAHDRADIAAWIDARRTPGYPEAGLRRGGDRRGTLNGIDGPRRDGQRRDERLDRGNLKKRVASPTVDSDPWAPRSPYDP